MNEKWIVIVLTPKYLLKLMSNQEFFLTISPCHWPHMSAGHSLIAKTTSLSYYWQHLLGNGVTFLARVSTRAYLEFVEHLGEALLRKQLTA